MPKTVVFELIWTNVWNTVISLHILEGSHHNYKRLVRVLIDLFNANVPRPFSHGKIVAISIVHTRWYLNHLNIPFPRVSYVFLFTESTSFTQLANLLSSQSSKIEKKTFSLLSFSLLLNGEYYFGYQMQWLSLWNGRLGVAKNTSDQTV